MDEKIEVGYTLLSKNKQLYRVDEVDSWSYFLTRVGYVDNQGREYSVEHSEFVFPLKTVTTQMRILSRNWSKYEAYLNAQPKGEAC